MTKKKKLILLSSASLLLVFAVLFFAVVQPWLISRANRRYTEPVELKEGEAYYRLGGEEYKDTPVMFPQLEYDDIFQLVVHNTDGEEYMFYHYLTDKKDYFFLGSYNDKSYDQNGSPDFFAPNISEQLATFDYTSLYDGQIKIPTLISMSGSVIFKQRIYTWQETDDKTEVQKTLHRYGLADTDGAPWFEVMPFLFDRTGRHIYTVSTPSGSETRPIYSDGDTGRYYYVEGVQFDPDAGEYVFDPEYLFTGDPASLTPAGNPEEARRVYVGIPTADDTGYYLRLDGRNTVYTVNNINSSIATFDYKNIVNVGLDYYVNPKIITDAATVYDPYFTKDFTVRTGTLCRTAGTAAEDGDTVCISYTSVYGGQEDGGTLTVEADSTDGSFLSKTAAALRVGQQGLALTDMQKRRSALRDGDTVRYSIFAIEGIYHADTGRYVTSGEAVAADSIICVSYTDGTPAISDDPGKNRGGLAVFSGMIDLSDPAVSTEFRAAVTGQTPATFAPGHEPELARVYHKTDAAHTYRYKITSVDAVLRDGREADTAQNGDTAAITYDLYIDGTLFGSAAFRLTVNTDSPSAVISSVSAAVVGRGKGPCDSPEFSLLYDEEGAMYDYIMYLGACVEYTVSYRTDISFGYYYFVGDGKPDDFMGDTNYMVKAPASLAGYAVDSDVIMYMLKDLGGLSGSETVCVGLDAAAMERYGLYAHHVSYTLPFGMEQRTDQNDNILSLTPKFEITYDLYISEAKDGTRYVGSSMYGTVVKVDASVFDFTEWTFLDGWARSRMLLLDINNIKFVEVDSDYTDLDRTYSFALTVDPAFKYTSSGSEYTAQRLYAAYVDGKIETGEEQYFSRGDFKIKSGYFVVTGESGAQYVTPIKNAVNLDRIYGEAGFDMAHEGLDYMGVYHFRHFINTLYCVNYGGAMDDEMSDALQQALIDDGSTLVLTITLGLTNGRIYSFRFYNYSARRSMVSVTAYGTDGTPDSESHEFFINSSETAKFVRFADNLSRGIAFAEDDIY